MARDLHRSRCGRRLFRKLRLSQHVDSDGSLYSFSMLARYQPRKWSEALDVDKSKSAAALEYAMDIALEVVPHLVPEGLDQEPLLLAKPMAF